MTDGDDRLSALPRWLMHRGRLASGQPDPNGQWVRWTDVAPLLAALTDDLAAAAHARTTLQRDNAVLLEDVASLRRILRSSDDQRAKGLEAQLAAAEQARTTLQTELDAANLSLEQVIEQLHAGLEDYADEKRAREAAEGDRRALQIALAKLQDENQRLKEEVAGFQDARL